MSLFSKFTNHLFHHDQAAPSLTVGESTQRIHRFKRNTEGRDFVVADIHGSFDLLVIAMAEVDFDPKVDRIFSTGDLIDRGDSSWRCTEFIALPYFHSTLGNHEAMLLDLYSRGEPPQEIIEIAASRNGFNWWLSVPQAERGKIVAAVRLLPYVIEVETAIGVVGIIHADVPQEMDWSEFTAAIEAQDQQITNACLWGRDRIDNHDRHGVKGIARVFVGHTPQWQGLSQFGNVFALDTGATFGLQGNYDRGRFTMVSLDVDEKHLTDNSGDRTMIDIRNN